MSTSFIYLAFGLQCYDYFRQDFVAGNVLNRPPAILSND